MVNRPKVFIISVIVLITIVVNAQPNLFMKGIVAKPTYSAGLHGMPFGDIKILNPHSFIVAGHYRRFGNSNFDTLNADGYLIKNDFSGATRWFKKYHLSGRVLYFSNVAITNNKDILAMGCAYSALEQQFFNGAFLRTDSNGLVKSFKLFPRQRFTSALLLSNEKIALVSSDSIAFLKLTLLDTSGHVEWCKRIISPYKTGAGILSIDLKEGVNKSLIILGYLNLGNGQNSFIIVTDSMGNKLNDLTHLSPYSYFNSVINYNNDYYFVGTHSIFNSFSGSILKTDPSLSVKSYQYFTSNNQNSQFLDIKKINRNSLMIATSFTGINQVNRPAITLIDSSCNIKRSFIYTKDSLSLWTNKIYPTQNGRFIFDNFASQHRHFGIMDTGLVGFCDYDTLSYSALTPMPNFVFNTFTLTNSSITYSSCPVYMYIPIDAELKYICSNGPTVPLDTTISNPQTQNNTGITTLVPKHDFSIYPNPANERIVIQNTAIAKPGSFEKQKLYLVNSLGITIVPKILSFENEKIEIDVKDLESGFYLLKIVFHNQEFVTKKLVVQH